MLQAAEIFQNSMVLQCGENIRVFGKAEPDAQVRVMIQGQEAWAQADENGSFVAQIPVLKPSEEECLIITDGKDSLRFEHVAVGEVWIASGQSNMEFWLRYEKHRKDPKAVSENPRIRFFDVPKIAYDGQREQFDYHNVGVWRAATETDLDYFSATGYYFARVLEHELDVPVGIVGCNWGGTTSSVWMSHETLEQVGRPWLAAYEERTSHMDMEAYWKEERQSIANDTGNAFWNPFNEFLLPQTPPPEDIASFFAALMQQVSPQGDAASDGQETGVQDILAVLNSRLKVQEIPACLYEHMVKTIGGFSARGVLWYQGESDDIPGRQEIYKDMMTGLIKDWRGLWDRNELPFLLVQLPGFGTWLGQPPFDYVTIRRQQELLCDTVPFTWLCSISDAGDQFDIHPKEKQVVGQRLALLALCHIYGKEILADAPRIDRVVKEEHTITLSFLHAGEGLSADEQELPMQVEMSGETIPFTYVIQGDQILLRTEVRLTSPVTISFAWENWFRVCLYNSAGIPAVPFRVSC